MGGLAGRWSDPPVLEIHVPAGLDCIPNDAIKVRLGAEDEDGEDR